MRSTLIFAAISVAFTGCAIGQQTAESCKADLHGFWREKDIYEAIELFKNLKIALDKDDRAAAASMMFYPLRVSGQYRVHNRTAFLNHYDRIFDSKVREGIERQIPECLAGNWQGFRTELGEVWIEALNGGHMKVIAVNSDSWPKESNRDHSTK
jgi:hypothetical protein